ncbi:MAG: adenylate/guanylate cyclase domain-containing protein [Acidobacteriota bacterium]|nr:adenylate/guanylate cyclase domain-containing protein [Acidobacteriota bacterium]
MPTTAVRYTPPAAHADCAPCFLIAGLGSEHVTRFPFYEQVEIGRDDGQHGAAGSLLIADRLVSRRHCIVFRGPDGRCWIRDVSRNGTRIDGRRLVPSIEVELRSGQKISVTEAFDLVLESPPLDPAPAPHEAKARLGLSTYSSSALVFATLLVGDIRDYTVLVRRAPLALLQQSVNRVLAALSEAVGHLGGTTKEYQGDALVAFWEGGAHGEQVVAKACHAALELDRRVRHLASDHSVWQVEGLGLEMDWALASGPVMINAFGGEQVGGLSMIGEPIVLAFRLEKFVNAETGRILVCPVTHQMAGSRFEFRDLGEMLAKGFSKPDRVFSLEREVPDPREEVGSS